MNNNKLNNQIPHRIAAYLGTQAGEIVKLEEWYNCYYVQVRGQRPTFISKNITLPCIPIWCLHQLHYGFSWERGVTLKHIQSQIEAHKNIVELCDWYGWSLEVDEYGWRVEGQHTTCYYGHLERDILARLADASAQPKKVIKPIIRKQPIPVVKQECEVYRVVKTWDNGNSYSAGRVISVLIQPVDYSQRPFWESVMKSQGIERNDILKRGRGRCLVKADISYGSAIATYA